MIYVSTLFDHKKDSKPLFTVLFDSTTKESKSFPIFHPGTSLTVRDAEKNRDAVAALFNGQPIVLNDYKQHLIAFGIDIFNAGRVYDHPLVPPFSMDIKEVKRALVDQIKKMMGEQKLWTAIRADAAPVYKYLQQRGAYFGYCKVNPIWHMDVYSGRTRTEGFSIQGLEEDAPISSIHGHDMFMSIDWISADFRMASILSGDQKLIDSFKVSDPYSYMADTVVGDGLALTRAESKKLLLQSLYSMDHESPAMSFYSGLGEWMRQCGEKLATDGYIENIFGRVFKVEGERSAKSAFNATIQGSVATGMQSCIRRIWEIIPDNILTENHDSLILTYHKGELQNRINEIVDIMTHPFRNILEDNPVFPVIVSIGSKYKLWKPLRRFGYE